MEGSYAAEQRERGSMNEQYLTVLQESLQKKINVMEEILRISQRQSEILVKEPVDLEEFDRCVDDKDVCIEQLNKLDEGFEVLYQRVAEELNGHREQYASWIRETQELITQVTEKSVEIQALEARNKQAVEAVFQKERVEAGHGKRSARVAMDYYRNMSNTHVVPPQYMDQKK